jgi:hypothetical protein
MLKQVDRFGFIEVNGKAFYLHWSLAGEWAKIKTRMRMQYAHTVVGRFKLSSPRERYMEKKLPSMPGIMGLLKQRISDFKKAVNPQVRLKRQGVQ